ncbi:MAG: hypothetical protein ACFE9N_17380 [Promethearchaeota archaeon]
MSGEIELPITLNLIECPLFPLCTLPKIQFLCKIPNCKNCPDYISKSEKIRK